MRYAVAFSRGYERELRGLSLLTDKLDTYPTLTHQTSESYDSGDVLMAYS